MKKGTNVQDAAWMTQSPIVLRFALRCTSVQVVVGITGSREVKVPRPDNWFDTSYLPAPAVLASVLGDLTFGGFTDFHIKNHSQKINILNCKSV